MSYSFTDPVSPSFEVIPTLNPTVGGYSCASTIEVQQYEDTIKELTDSLNRMNKSLADSMALNCPTTTLQGDHSTVTSDATVGATGFQPPIRGTLAEGPGHCQLTHQFASLNSQAMNQGSLCYLSVQDKENARLKRELEKLRRRMEEAENEESANDQLKEELDDANLKIKQLTDKNRRAEERIKRLQKSIESDGDDEESQEKELQIRRLKQQMETLQEDLQNSSTSYEDVVKQKEELETEKSKLKDMKTTLEKENQQLKRQTVELQEQQEQASRCDDMERELKKKTEEIKRLKRELEEARKRSEYGLSSDTVSGISTMRRNDRRMKELEEDLKERERRIKELEDETDEIEDLKRTVKQKDREIEKLKREHKRNCDATKSDIETEYERRLEEERDTYHEQLKKKEATWKNLKQKLENKVKALEEKIENLEANPGVAPGESKTIEEYKEKIAKLEKKIQDFKRMHDEKIRNLKEEHRKDIDSEKQRIKDLEKNLNAMNDKKKELNNKIIEIRTEKENVLVQLHQKEQDAENSSAAEKECDLLKTKLAKKEEELASERMKFRKVSDHERVLERRAQEEIKLVNDLTTTNDRLSHDMNNIMARLRNVLDITKGGNAKVPLNYQDCIVELETEVQRLMKEIEDATKYIDLLRKEMKMKGSTQKNAELTQTIEQTSALLAETRAKQKEAEDGKLLMENRCQALSDFIIFLQDRLELITTPTFESRTQPLPIYRETNFFVGQAMPNEN